MAEHTAPLHAGLNSCLHRHYGLTAAAGSFIKLYNLESQQSGPSLTDPRSESSIILGRGLLFPVGILSAYF